MPRNRVHWTQFLYIEIESDRLGFCTYKSSPVDSVFVHWNQVHWTWFLFGPPRVLQIALKKISKQHSQSLSFPPTLSLSYSHSHSHSLSLRLSLSFPLAPSPSISLSLIPSPALLLHHHRPSTLSPSSSQQSLPSGNDFYPNNRRVSFSFDLFYVVFGFYIIVWMIVWIVFVF